eukprot:11171126-Lingulodinium_polyedra.AAC.1
MEGVRGVYHGTSAGAFPQILQAGIRFCLGAGADVLANHHGVPAPCVYAAPPWKVASQYPSMSTTAL